MSSKGYQKLNCPLETKYQMRCKKATETKKVSITISIANQSRSIKMKIQANYQILRIGKPRIHL